MRKDSVLHLLSEYFLNYKKNSTPLFNVGKGMKKEKRAGPQFILKIVEEPAKIIMSLFISGTKLHQVFQKINDA